MPRLILFAPCENLIISNENKISLISLLETITVGIPQNQPIPANATLPMRWFALTTWERQHGDADREFESYIEAGPLRSITARFRMATPLHRVMAQIIGFPLQFGEMRLRAHFRQVGGEFAVVGEYPLTVQRTAPVVVPQEAN
jgi:hypothetical protein